LAGDEEVKEAEHRWMREQTTTLFSHGIMKLMNHYKKCLELQGDYAE
jgi:hypothetical protein